MSKLVMLSEKTHDLIDKIKLPLLDGLSRQMKQIDDKQLLSILTHLDSRDHHQLFLLESLRASLLHDLRCSFINQNNAQKQKKAGLLSRVIFWMLFLSGTILAVCDGYDAISSLLPLLSAPVWIGQLLVGVFVLLSVASFHAFDLSQISDNLGVKLPESHKLLDILSEQVQDILLIRKYLKKEITKHSSEALSDCSPLLEMLQYNQKRLNAMQELYNKRSDSRYLMVAKFVIGLITGLLFFLSGFFVSQAPAVALFTALGLSAAAMVWPVFLTTIAIGIAAFSLYWFVQRPGMDNFIARLFGLDTDKIAALNPCKIDLLSGEEVDVISKLGKLKKILDLKLERRTMQDPPKVQSFFAPAAANENLQHFYYGLNSPKPAF